MSTKILGLAVEVIRLPVSSEIFIKSETLAFCLRFCTVSAVTTIRGRVTAIIIIPKNFVLVGFAERKDFIRLKNPGLFCVGALSSVETGALGGATGVGGISSIILLIIAQLFPYLSSFQSSIDLRASLSFGDM